MNRNALHGLLVLDKPGGMTSRDVVDRVQRWFPRGARIGHTGTLDPLATGVLVLCLGAATRLTEYVQDMDKVYRAGLRLGARSDTDDADGAVTPVEGVTPPRLTDVSQTLQAFVGVIDQVPPVFSAAKVTGKRAYDLARRGAQVTLQPRPVHVYGIQTLTYEYPRLELEVHCGKGTYIRSLARDLGDRLGCGALVEVLRRTRVGLFRAEDAVSLDADAAAARATVLPMRAAIAQLPQITVDIADVARLRHGQLVFRKADVVPNGEAAAFDSQGCLIGIVSGDQEQGCLRPVKMLPPEVG